MINIKTKKAFSMVTAIIVIVIMATVSALIMNITGKTVKATTQQFQKEQAQLLARSYTELAILYVINYDRTAGTGSCLEKLTDHFGATGNNGYDINITISYIGNDENLDGCTKTILNTGIIGTASDITDTATWTTTGRFHDTISMVIDTYITYKDFDDPQTRDITFHRRTLQKL